MKNYIKALLLILCITGCNGFQDKKVLIQPYGNIDQKYVNEAVETIKNTYGFEVYVAQRTEMPKSAFVNVKSPRYRADSLLRIQKLNKPDSIDFVIGLTNLDISTTKRDGSGNVRQPESKYADWGVFGLGYRPGCSSIVSTFRLKTQNEKLLIERMRKVCNHELGHNLGLPHCKSDASCVLRDAAETIKTVDTVSDTLCSACKRRI